LKRQAEASQNYFNIQNPGNHYIASKMKTQHSSQNTKMHAQNGKRKLRSSGLQEEHVGKKVQRNGFFKRQEQDLHSNGHNGTAQTNGHASKANDVHIPLPDNHAQDVVLDTILTGWIILMCRYQRDAFNQFTWGLKSPGSDQTQCISGASLNMMSVETAGSLKAIVSEVRSKDISTDRATFMLNDGTKEEVHHTYQLCIDCD
jgi:hypothetical protein